MSGDFGDVTNFVTQSLEIDMLPIMLGSKTLGTNVSKFQFVICWQTMIKT